MDSREERLAKNEVLFREINERIEEAAAPHGRRDGHVFEFFCECSNADCTLLLPMTLASYEAVRSNPEAFVIAPGHDLPEIETVIARHPAYQVVRKGGEAVALARDTDPRGWRLPSEPGKTRLSRSSAATTTRISSSCAARPRKRSKASTSVAPLPARPPATSRQPRRRRTTVTSPPR
ncbi:MAG: hypothetical protein E6F98_00475 [Actinobacteria bacterium]|nr:MAG: hypothetical protein E6F98_00475 [Actinomycetota bacterium]